MKVDVLSMCLHQINFDLRADWIRTFFALIKNKLVFLFILWVTPHSINLFAIASNQAIIVKAAIVLIVGLNESNFPVIALTIDSEITKVIRAKGSEFIQTEVNLLKRHFVLLRVFIVITILPVGTRPGNMFLILLVKRFDLMISLLKQNQGS